METRRPADLVLSQFLVAMNQGLVGAGDIVGDDLLSRAVKYYYKSPATGYDLINIVPPTDITFIMENIPTDQKVVIYMDHIDSQLIRNRDNGVKLGAALIFDIYDNSKNAIDRHNLTVEDRKALASVMDFLFSWIIHTANSPYGLSSTVH